MKAVILPLLAVSALAAPARAQVSVGAFGAATQSYLSARGRGPDFIFDGRGSYGAGAVLSWAASPRLSLELQPGFVSKGDEPLIPRFTRAGLDVVTWKAETRLSYFELPLLAKYAPFARAALRPYVLAGPTLAFRRSARLLAYRQDGAGNRLELLNTDITENVRSTDFGLGLGAGVKIPAGRAALFLEGQYTLGLTRIDEEPGSKNRTLQLKLGFTVPVSGRR